MSAVFVLCWTSVINVEGIVVRACSLASFRKVSKLMDVETMISRSQSGELCVDLYLLTLSLNHFNQTIHARVSVWVHDANSVVGLCFWGAFHLKSLVV